MGWILNFSSRQTLHCLTISLLILVISSFSQIAFKAEGRKLVAGHAQTESVEKAIMRSQIGSRPPRCESRCVSCGHCVAIQVPTNRQINSGNKNHNITAKVSSSNIAYARNDDNSNYKPMSWKCKCGNLIFNP